MMVEPSGKLEEMNADCYWNMNVNGCVNESKNTSENIVTFVVKGHVSFARFQ
jgi:hypothetical protein